MTVHVLVVGDNPDNADLAKSVLSPLGYQVIPANGVALALFLAHKNYPNLILCDHATIDGSGLEFIREVRQDPDLQAIPIVFLASPGCTAATKSAATAMGIQGYLEQPVARDRFLDQVSIYLEERDDEREPDTPE